MTSVVEALATVASALAPERGPAAGVRDWTAGLALANDHLLSPAIYSALTATGRIGELPDDVRDYLELLHRLNGERNQALRRQAVELITALIAAGVEPMLLKGGLQLFRQLHRDPAARMIRDLDVLVPDRLRPQTTDVLQALGYRVATKYEAGHNAYADFARPNDPGAVDLHVEIIEMPHLLSAAEVWSRAGLLTADGARFWAPSDTDIVLHHLLHAQIHYLGNFYRGILDLRQVYEFSLFLSGAANVDWAVVAARFARHRLETVLDSYILIAQELFGGRWPLARPASAAGRLHCRRCVVQLHHPALASLLVPYANIRAAFAWHRMNQVRGDRGTVTVARLMHAAQYLRKKAAWAVVRRVLRTQ